MSRKLVNVVSRLPIPDLVDRSHQVTHDGEGCPLLDRVCCLPTLLTDAYRVFSTLSLCHVCLGSVSLFDSKVEFLLNFSLLSWPDSVPFPAFLPP